MSEQLAAFDDAHFLGPAERRALQHREDRRCGMAKRLRRVLSRTHADANSEAKRSPVPDGLIGSFGVRTRQASLDRSTATVSIWPSGMSNSSALVTTIVDGPRASRACACAIT